MACEEAVLSIMKKLENDEDESASETKELLTELGKLDINLKVLTSTKIGMKINVLRKTHKDEEVIAVARALIKSWKKLVPDKEGKKEKEGESKFAVLKKDKNKPKKEYKEEEKRIDHEEVKRTSLSSVRESCTAMLLTAIKGEGELPEGCTLDPEALANEVEEEIFDKYNQENQPGPKYKQQVRSRVFNLRDKLNPNLRTKLLLGVFSPKDFSRFSSEQMSSDDKKAQRAKDEKESMDQAQLAHVEGTVTDLLKCGKCKKRNCTYNQLQTRSADEPMTTFVLCNECGNRWKFC